GILAVLDVGAVPPDAIDREVFLSSLANASEVLAFSACREATITVVVPEGQRSATARFSLADPRYLQLVKLPMKGSITAHSECGYSVVPEDVQVASSVDIAQAALDELTKLKEAYDKGKANA